MTPPELSYYLIVYLLFTSGRVEYWISPEPMAWEVCKYHVTAWDFLGRVDKSIAVVNASCERDP